MPDPAKLFLGPRPDSARALQTSPSLDTGGEQRPDPTPSRGIAPVDINRGQVHGRGHGAPSPPDEAGAALTFSGIAPIGITRPRLAIISRATRGRTS